jgi:hypothetical protein
MTYEEWLPQWEAAVAELDLIVSTMHDCRKPEFAAWAYKHRMLLFGSPDGTFLYTEYYHRWLGENPSRMPWAVRSSI